jgi:sRNA-binding protein
MPTTAERAEAEAKARIEQERKDRQANEQRAIKAARERIAAEQEAVLKTEARAAFAGNDYEFTLAWPGIRQSIAVAKTLEPKTRKWGI